MKSVDQGWLEIFGGQGAYKRVLVLIKNNQDFQVKFFNFFIFSILFFMVILISF